MMMSNKHLHMFFLAQFVFNVILDWLKKLKMRTRLPVCDERRDL